MNFKHLLAERTGIMGTSAIREILKVVGKPGMISLAGGIPAPESFPMSIIHELTEKVLHTYGSSAFQYDLTEGFGPLQEQLSVLLAEGTDLHTSTFNQALAAEYLKGEYLKQHLPKIIKLYQPKQNAMLNAISRYFPENFLCSASDGGMFLWVEGPKGTDVDRIFKSAIKQNVAFVPGKYFFTDKNDGRETMRLNYTMCDEKTIDKAIKILSHVINDSVSSSF